MEWSGRQNQAREEMLRLTTGAIATSKYLMKVFTGKLREATLLAGGQVAS